DSMTILEACILGFVQGLTQFLPLSATGHLCLVPWFFRWPEPTLALRVFLTSGAFLSLLVCFGKEWWYIVRGGIISIIERKIGFDRDRAMFWMLGFACLPSVVAGLLFHNVVREEMTAPLLVAISLSSVGFLLYWIDARYAALRGAEELRMKDAFWIGVACAVGM